MQPTIERMTLVDAFSLRGDGIYVIACYPALGCLYIGSTNNVGRRIMEHVALAKPLGNFLRLNMVDSYRFRVDVLRPPDGAETNEWMLNYETKLIEHFRPMFNTSGLGEIGS